LGDPHARHGSTPYPDTPELDQYQSIRLTYPNKYFDPPKGAQLLKRYLDEYAYTATAGFDGLMGNEHHNTPICSVGMSPSA